MKQVQLELEKKAYQDFMALWHNGKFNNCRFGQAFYDYFKLYKMSNQDRFGNLYNVKTKDEAHKIIGEVFRII